MEFTAREEQGAYVAALDKADPDKRHREEGEVLRRGAGQYWFQSGWEAHKEWERRSRDDQAEQPPTDDCDSDLREIAMAHAVQLVMAGRLVNPIDLAEDILKFLKGE